MWQSSGPCAMKGTVDGTGGGADQVEWGSQRAQGRCRGRKSTCKGQRVTEGAGRGRRACACGEASGSVKSRGGKAGNAGKSLEGGLSSLDPACIPGTTWGFCSGRMKVRRVRYSPRMQNLSGGRKTQSPRHVISEIRAKISMLGNRTNLK